MLLTPHKSTLFALFPKKITNSPSFHISTLKQFKDPTDTFLKGSTTPKDLVCIRYVTTRMNSRKREVNTMARPFYPQEADDADLDWLISNFLYERPNYVPVEVGALPLILIPYKEVGENIEDIPHQSEENEEKLNDSTRKESI